MKANLQSPNSEKKAMRKNIVLVLFFILISILSYSNTSELSLRLYDNSNFALIIDGVYYSNSREYTITRLSPGNHQVKVIKRFGNKGKKVLFNNFIFIPSFTKIIAEITPYHQFVIRHQIALVDYYAPQNPNFQNDNSNNGNPGGNYNNYHYIAMSTDALVQLRQTLINIPFDDTKLNVAKQAVSLNYLYSGQVLELLSTMTFESSRLEFAKFA